jgi:hypothetical protein
MAESTQLSVPFAGTTASPITFFLRVLRSYYLLILLISAALLVPCFWHKHVISCDLASHTYNAWLATLIERGQAPSLYIAHQWNNVFFDIILLQLCKLFGFALGEKLAVSLLVLLFFWGSFALAAAASRRAPWFVVPLLAMVAYGWTFAIGFSNYYLSLALAFWGIAYFWRAPAWHIVFAIPFAGLIYLAHPFGVAWFVGATVFVFLSRWLPGMAQIFLAALGIGLVFAARLYLRNHYSMDFSQPRYLVSGIDQLILSVKFRLLAKILLYFGAACFLFDLYLSRKEVTLVARLATPISLYVVSLATVLLLPDAIFLPQYALPFSFITMRLTAICAVSAICVLAMMAPRYWSALGFLVAAGFFFFLLWQETKPIEALETQAEQLIATIPANHRVIATIRPFPSSRFYFPSHLVDRACIGKCFSYSNYEPSSRQFRVHVLPGSPIADSSALAADKMQMGTYVVQAADLPAYQIEQCTSDLSKLCIRELKEGEVNGRLAPALPK